ncbi:MAG: DUF932 domain-containing protein [Bacteroidetes bacterium]|jgi:hypothetical protein|nr:DUF932 domain-containing protein [Bacteroidota bacterium]
MQHETTLEKVYDKVDLMSKNCFDQNIDVPEIKFDSLDRIRISGESHTVRPVAQRAISNRLGIPYNYLKKCPQEIQADNLNYWIEKEKNDRLFFRFDGDDVRALFTPRYVPVDNFEALYKLDQLGFKPETKVQCSLDPEFMSLSIPDGKKAFEIDGDKFTPGISISNSEVGLASLSISAFVLRLICTNGLISSSGVSASYRHVSTKILEEFPNVLEKVSSELGNKRDQFKISMDSVVDNPEGTMLSFNRQFNVNKVEQDAVEWGWAHDVGETMFHIIQAYTKGSQHKDLSAESSFKLQRTGGNILAMVN